MGDEIQLRQVYCHAYDHQEESCHPPVQHNGKPLLTTSSHPYIGLILSSDCGWSDHINKITTNAKQTTRTSSPVAVRLSLASTNP